MAPSINHLIPDGFSKPTVEVKQHGFTPLNAPFPLYHLQSNGYHDQQKLTDMEDESIEPIAIIGLAFELPGGITTPESFWDTLSNGRSKLSKIPQERWNLDGFYREGATRLGVVSFNTSLLHRYTHRSQHNVQHSHFLERDIAAFDAPFFRITVNEAHAMDPQQRILLETSYRALENGRRSLKSHSFD